MHRRGDGDADADEQQPTVHEPPADGDDEVHDTIGTPPVDVRKARTSTGAFAPTVIHPDATVDEVPTAVKDVAASALAPGVTLAGRYRIGALVGQGGMGAVYSAHDADLDEDVALKLLRPDLARDVAYQKRLRAEVRLARRVSHPNVCRVHDIGVAGDSVFVTMELVRGRTLRYLLGEVRAGRAPPFELAQVVDIVLQIGAALIAAHRAGVIHRDVKPDNVIVTEGRVVLTDFGIAARSAESADQVAGTPAYLAPEVLRHEPFDHKVDVYALGVVAYELLARRTPFGARTIEAATRFAHQRPPYPELPADAVADEVRAALDRVLQRALSTEPATRTPAVDRFTDAFALAVRDAPPAALSSSGVPTPVVDSGSWPIRAFTGDPTPTPSGRLGRATAETTPRSASGLTDPPVLRRPEVRVATALAWRSLDERDVLALEAAERVVVDAGGTPIKVGGGEVIALFGAPRSLGDDAERAARAALAVVGAHGGRAGLDTTRVLLRPGVAEIAGPDVATGAMALAAAAGRGQVLASPGAARQLAARFQVKPAGAGLRVTALRSTESAARGADSSRPRELGALVGHLERAFRERVPVTIEVRGGPGAGKTRLREALVAAINAHREVDWLVAIASPVGAPAPLATIHAASPEWYDVATGAGTLAEPARRHTAARRWLEARATRRPVVVIVDDVQWSDPSSRALLEYLRTGLGDVPVAIVTFARCEERTTAAPQPGVEVVTLGPLDADAARRLARSIAPNAGKDAIARIVARAAGNPFFIEELARELAEGSAETVLPASIEAVVQARLDHLPESASHVLVAAAVIGRVFWRSTVAALAGDTDDALDAALAELERRGVITATAPVTLDDDRYQFDQVVVRDVAYARIPPRDRRAFHAQIAQWLEAKAQDRKDDVALVLDAAHHREQAGDAAGAATAYARAGRRCLALFAYGEAATALRRAVALGNGRDAGLHEDLGDALAETEGPVAAELAYEAAAMVTAPDDDPRRARLWSKLATSAARRYDAQKAIERYRAGLAIAAPDDQLAGWALVDPRVAAKLYGGLGWTLGYQLGRVDEGHPMCERAITLLEGTPYRRDLAQALSRLGGTYMRACRFADQLTCNQRNLDIARELADLGMQLTAYINLGVVHQVLGSIEEAIAATQAARSIAARIGAAVSAGLVASNLAGLLLERGAHEEADEALAEALDLIERTGHRYVLCETYTIQARLAAARNDLDAARRHAEAARSLARTLGNELDAAVATRVLAQIASRAEDHDTARALVDEALAAATAADAFEAARTRAARARILRAAGDPGADAAIAASRTELRQLGAGRELEILERLDEVR